MSVSHCLPQVTHFVSASRDAQALNTTTTTKCITAIKQIVTGQGLGIVPSKMVFMVPEFMTVEH